MPYANPEKRREYDRLRRERDGEQMRIRAREYYSANREQRLEYAKRRADPEAKREYDRAYAQRADVRERRARQRRAWATRNAAATAAHNRARSHARRGARPDARAKEYMRVLLLDPCAYCGGAMEHVDHITPLKMNGSAAWDNLTAACQKCNYAKRDKPLLLFLSDRPC